MGDYLLERVSVIIKISVLFWPEISALGYFLILITSVCTPLNIKVPPPPWGLSSELGEGGGVVFKMGGGGGGISSDPSNFF